MTVRSGQRATGFRVTRIPVPARPGTAPSRSSALFQFGADGASHRSRGSVEASTRPTCPQGQAILSNIVIIASFTRHKVGPTLLKKRDGRHQWTSPPTPAKREPQNAPRRRNVRRYAVINPLKRCTWLLPANGKSWPSKLRNWNGSACVVQSRIARGSMIFGSKFFLKGGVLVGRSLGILETPRAFRGQEAAEAAPVAPAEKARNYVGRSLRRRHGEAEVPAAR
jgi:hypothetical protein